MSGGVIFDEALGSVGRITLPARGDVDGWLYDEAYGPRSPHPRRRPITVVEPAPTTRTVGLGGKHADPGIRLLDQEWLEVTCWCEETVQQVPAEVVREGRTVRCRSRWCHPPYQFDWDEVATPEGPVLVAAPPMCHAHSRPIDADGCPECLAEYATRGPSVPDRHYCGTHRWYTGGCCPRCGAAPEEDL